MVEVSREFVARKLWLLVAVVTLPVTALATILAGLLPLPGAVVALLVTGIPIVGWLLLTPLLLFFGEEIADAFVGDFDGEEPDEDPVESLKRRYADGEIGTEEFERRLDRLLEHEDVGESSGHGESQPPRRDDEGAGSSESPDVAAEPEDALERE